MYTYNLRVVEGGNVILTSQYVKRESLPSGQREAKGARAAYWWRERDAAWALFPSWYSRPPRHTAPRGPRTTTTVLTLQASILQALTAPGAQRV